VVLLGDPLLDWPPVHGRSLAGDAVGDLGGLTGSSPPCTCIGARTDAFYLSPGDRPTAGARARC
jgi:hypothetical protein